MLQRLIVTAAAATAFTLAVSVTSAIRFSYRSPELHVAVETTAVLISSLAAVLCYGRFRRTFHLRDAVLVVALGAFAVSNLCFSAIPGILRETGPFATWAPVGGRIVSATLFAAAAYLPARTLARPDRDAWRMAAAVAAILALVAIAVVVAGDRLPAAIEPGLSPEASERPRIVGNPVVLAAQLLAMVLFAVAAPALARRATREQDPLLGWFAIGAVLAAFARLNYFLFPSLYSEWFYAGDVLRLAFFLALLAGGIHEIRAGEAALAAGAVVDERRRIARDLHDGMAQDLAFIVQHGRRLARRPDAPPAMADIVTAAERALEDSRHAISALTRPSDEPLPVALERAAREVTARAGAEVVVHGIADLQVPDSTREALVRIVREAASNAVRHGAARHVTVELDEPPGIDLRIRDDGVGFDPDGARDAGRFGLTGMRERALALGGDVVIRSAPGEGTEVRVHLP